MNTIKFVVSLVILLGILSCSKVSQKVEQKVNEKIDKTIDENLKKVDSTMAQADIDSLKRMMKSIDSSLKFDIKLDDKK